VSQVTVSRYLTKYVPNCSGSYGDIEDAHYQLDDSQAMTDEDEGHDLVVVIQVVVANLRVLLNHSVHEFHMFVYQLLVDLEWNEFHHALLQTDEFEDKKHSRLISKRACEYEVEGDPRDQINYKPTFTVVL
jgi:hypothetical protein